MLRFLPPCKRPPAFLLRFFRCSIVWTETGIVGTSFPSFLKYPSPADRRFGTDPGRNFFLRRLGFFLVSGFSVLVSLEACPYLAPGTFRCFLGGSRLAWFAFLSFVPLPSPSISPGCLLVAWFLPFLHCEKTSLEKSTFLKISYATAGPHLPALSYSSGLELSLWFEGPCPHNRPAPSSH